MAHRRVMRMACVAALTAVAACSSLTGSGGAPLWVSLTLERAMESPPTLRVTIGGRRVDVTSASGPAEVRLRPDGPVPVTAVLLDAGGDTLAHAAFEHHIRRDHGHWITASVGMRRPLGFCFGEAIAAPLRRASADTMFVVYGSIPDGAVC